MWYVVFFFFFQLVVLLNVEIETVFSLLTKTKKKETMSFNLSTKGYNYDSFLLFIWKKLIGMFIIKVQCLYIIHAPYKVVTSNYVDFGPQ